MPLNMEYSEAGMDITKKEEGLRLEAYRDSGGLWTIGYGHLFSPDPKADFAGLVWTQEQADEAFAKDIGNA